MEVIRVLFFLFFFFPFHRPLCAFFVYSPNHPRFVRRSRTSFFSLHLSSFSSLFLFLLFYLIFLCIFLRIYRSFWYRHDVCSSDYLDVSQSTAVFAHFGFNRITTLGTLAELRLHFAHCIGLAMNLF